MEICNDSSRAVGIFLYHNLNHGSSMGSARRMFYAARQLIDARAHAKVPQDLQKYSKLVVYIISAQNNWSTQEYGVGPYYLDEGKTYVVTEELFSPINGKVGDYNKMLFDFHAVIDGYHRANSADYQAREEEFGAAADLTGKRLEELTKSLALSFSDDIPVIGDTVQSTLEFIFNLTTEAPPSEDDRLDLPEIKRSMDLLLQRLETKPAIEKILAAHDELLSNQILVRQFHEHGIKVFPKEEQKDFDKFLTDARNEHETGSLANWLSRCARDTDLCQHMIGMYALGIPVLLYLDRVRFLEKWSADDIKVAAQIEAVGNRVELLLNGLDAAIRRVWAEAEKLRYDHGVKQFCPTALKFWLEINNRFFPGNECLRERNIEYHVLDDAKKLATFPDGEKWAEEYRIRRKDINVLQETLKSYAHAIRQDVEQFNRERKITNLLVHGVNVAGSD